MPVRTNDKAVKADKEVSANGEMELTGFESGGKNMVRVAVHVRGTRPLVQHHFGPDAIPLEDRERQGKAGNDPSEWKRSCMVNGDGVLYILGEYVFGCMRNGARHIKKGKSNLMPNVASTLQVEEMVIPILNRHMPDGEPRHNHYEDDVYVHVCGVVNKATKSRNVRYRLTAREGWECRFTLYWDKTIVSRQEMQSVLGRAATLYGLGDGLKVGMGRFEVLDYRELTDNNGADNAQGATAARTVEPTAKNGMGAGRPQVRPLR